MKIDVTKKLPDKMDTIVLLLGDKTKGSGAFEHLPAEYAENVDAFIEEGNFDFKYNTIKTLHHVCHKGGARIILCGLGDRHNLTVDRFRNLIASCIRAAIQIKSKEVFLFFPYAMPFSDTALGHVITEGCLLACYRFQKYQSDSPAPTPVAVHAVLDNKNTRHLNHGILEGRIYAEMTLLARDLVNEPANVMTPETLAEAAKQAALDYGFGIDIIMPDRIRRMKMDAFLAVGRGSASEPRLIIMRYRGNPEKKSGIGLVGKGLTFDSGGYCIKQPQGMLNMKNDMGGAAAVIGTMAAIARLNLKVNVVAIIAACENMISGSSYRPGDIIRSMAGKTIEVINTDAEGRLTLIDAVHYIIEREHASKVIDIATLTGAAMAALGPGISAVFTNDEEWMKKLREASEISGERIWQLPVHEEYREMLRSDVADLKNVGGPLAGAITAALFIREFVEGKPWIHIDIAGTAWRDKENGLYSIGATGVGVRLLISLFKLME